jgi:hypothetical protein
MKITKILIQSAFVCLVLALASGCASQKTWVYRSNTYPPPASCTGKKIAVLAYEDGRENKNNNLWGMYLIPVMPFGWQNYDSPEGVQMHMNSGMWINYKPTEDYPKALAEDLKKTGLFSDAFFDYRRESGDYAVKGKILNTRYNGYLISYGLSVYCPYLWLVGFPCTTTRNDLSVEISLVDSKTDRPLFSKTYTAEPRKGVSWIYVMKNDFNYAEMLAELNKQFCTDIQPVVLANPAAASVQ